MQAAGVNVFPRYASIDLVKSRTLLRALAGAVICPVPTLLF
jgi:hypothetical protein